MAGERRSKPIFLVQLQRHRPCHLELVRPGLGAERSCPGAMELAEHAADALRYAEYCKRKAVEAIDRYNLHIEMCNRVIEGSESGIATPETANLEDQKRELQRLKSDNQAKDFEVARLTEELKHRTAEQNTLTARVTAAEEWLKVRIGTGSESANAELVERIQRLEAENRRLKQGRAAAAKTAAGNGTTPGGY